ncbi:hypothetical protein [Neorhizobium sp. NCHU2750]|uniref:hypothetical protein n=1 Tax=Neorhizobium sp. NCHU2750 TaxID=1825976 RepID=UPI000E73130E|nr:hypothetical protein NCHU2750_25550 [Neorhizobium sp. NCHU2750]
MDYQTTASTSDIVEQKHDCHKAAEAALASMLKMLESYGFDRREMVLSLADAIDDQILLIAQEP